MRSVFSVQNHLCLTDLEQRLNQEASSNKAKNDAAYKQWLATHDPLAIKKANKARQTLRKQAKNPKRTSRYAPIKDDRLVKEPRTAWIYFLISRQASGDFKGLTLSETSKLISKEWHTLPANEKEVNIHPVKLHFFVLMV